MSTKPAKRKWHSMTYIGNNKIILFGGDGETQKLQDTWEYDIDNHTWTEYNQTGNKPSQRYSHSMTYIGNNKTLMFGGRDNNNDLQNDTWIYISTDHTWIKYNLNGMCPSIRESQSMSYIGNGKIVMFGGLQGVDQTNDIWLYTSEDFIDYFNSQ